MYKSSDYIANPNGTFDNRWWPGGIVAILVGLFIVYIALFVKRQRKKKDETPVPGQPSSSIPPYPSPPYTSYQQAPPR